MTLVESLKADKWPYLILLLLVAVLYHTVVPQMALDWYHDANYSHGFVVPLIAGYFLYEMREELQGVAVEPWWPGLALVGCGVVQLVLGWLATELFTMRSSIVVLLGGLTLFFFGKGAFRLMLFPICYLFFMVPLPYIVYDAVAFPLKLFVTKASIAFLKLMGVVVLSEGNIIILPETTLEVADACSGIRSLISLLALTVAYAFFLRIPPLKRVLLIGAAVPVAVFTNALRVIVTGFLAQYWGARAAEGFFHEFAGLAVFGVAIAMVVSFGGLLARSGKGGS
ncbi:exosortase/archaeosortase family protein [Geomonas sp. RF6]|uniref:exosortase A n=1 Tax=Geomonas sp. RF6 TaxID=2897342 RepID=UPI001E3D585A|nr:exosortase A [Geomonas sp. RF6]UFS69152.1 exosortase/archaeosortase family protein [Geomonas sp. RF6]